MHSVIGERKAVTWEPGENGTGKRSVASQTWLKLVDGKSFGHEEWV